ncbi:hypothetical protein METHB2_20138 [Candidatus Methylobacter favarea]|uniref:Uncharacterized protein n=1 Tax=Candidatus Methylobacter favarea TaxID=2707345 RepID=A0A8S0X7R9_9GAMM|nr:hypothetical protein METHB2_20138 [Candidatus Methylobacter favarea]
MKLNKINATDKTGAEILEGLSENFTFDNLCESITRYCDDNNKKR